MSTLPRRGILKAAAASAFVGSFAGTADAGQAEPPQEWGGWFMAAGGNKHMPVVTSERRGEDAVVSFTVKHPQGAAHHIMNVRLFDENRVEIASVDFSPTLSTPQASMSLRLPAGTKLYAVSNCNKHGLWYSEFTV